MYSGKFIKHASIYFSLSLHHYYYAWFLGTVPLAKAITGQVAIGESAIMVLTVGMTHVIVQQDGQELNVETVSMINYVEY